jgi:hypothetical protein
MIKAGAAPPITAVIGTYWLCYLAILLAGLAALLALAHGEPRLWHWYLVPVFLCLVVVALDTALLASGEVALFSPIGLFGLIGVQSSSPRRSCTSGSTTG